MLSYIGDTWSQLWGPIRLLGSYFFLAVSGTLVAALATWWLVPTLRGYLPTDRGRVHAVDADASRGKPLGAGVILVGVIVLSIIVFVPYTPGIYSALPLMVLAAVVGFLDDRSGGLSELTLGLSDLALSMCAALLLFGLEPATIWVPFTSDTFLLPAWLNLAVVTGVIWFSINAVNCNDGVDGLSATLSVVSVGSLGGLFYFVIGNAPQSAYLLVPHDPQGANWALGCVLVIGVLGGYLWHNVPPSSVLMGDAGSRPLGLFLGVVIAAAQNPFLIIFGGFMILLNGGTGLAKVALLRFLRIRIFSGVRFPLHDHVRTSLHWSTTQVLARFTLMHVALTALLLGFLLKVR